VQGYGLVALIFAREVSDPLISLVKAIDGHLERCDVVLRPGRERPGVHVVFCSDDPGLKERLDKLIAKEGIRHVVFSISKNSSQGPPRYRVAREAELTVVLYAGLNRVVANYALDSVDLTADLRGEILKSVRTILPRSVAPTSREQPQEWRFTTTAPPEGWIGTDFNDSTWKKGPGGFGTFGTPGARVRTVWNTADIWLRRTVELPQVKVKGRLRLLIHHDEDAEVYLNGVRLAGMKGYTTDYRTVELGPEALQSLRPGRNVLAVHCHQTGGGQYIDVGLVLDAQ
jgi:hypothetical protein